MIPSEGPTPRQSPVMLKFGNLIEQYSRASISVKQCLTLHELSPIFTTLTLERIMGIAQGIFLEREQLPEHVN